MPSENIFDFVSSRKLPGGEGAALTLASDYARKALTECAHENTCLRNENAESIIKSASKKLSFCQPRTEIISKTTRKGMKDLTEGIRVPKNAILVFKNTLVTKDVDRDKDIVHPSGAKPSKKVPVLWSHIGTLPIGGTLKFLSPFTERVQTIGFIVDLKDLFPTKDVVSLIEASILSFSQGMLPMEWEPRRDSQVGAEVKEFEIVEQSTVSVPSLREAQFEEIQRIKLNSSYMKSIIGQQTAPSRDRVSMNEVETSFDIPRKPPLFAHVKMSVGDSKFETTFGDNEDISSETKEHELPKDVEIDVVDLIEEATEGSCDCNDKSSCGEKGKDKPDKDKDDDKNDRTDKSTDTDEFAEAIVGLTVDVDDIAGETPAETEKDATGIVGDSNDLSRLIGIRDGIQNLDKSAFGDDVQESIDRWIADLSSLACKMSISQEESGSSEEAIEKTVDGENEKTAVAEFVEAASQAIVLSKSATEEEISNTITAIDLLVGA